MAIPMVSMAAFIVRKHRVMFQQRLYGSQSQDIYYQILHRNHLPTTELLIL